MPNITKTTINKICSLIARSDKEIILPKFKNRTGNPIGFKQSMIKNIYKKSIKMKVDPKISKRVWMSMIRGFIDYEFRNFKKK